jgi:drug/metabolite transporter (DMT)-like permease
MGEAKTRYGSQTDIMTNFILYASAALIWGSTWLGIKLQLTQVPPILSVGYRFCLASLILCVYCLLRNKRMVFSRRDHLFMAIQGFTLFGLGYCIMMWNILNLKLFMGQPIAWRAFWGGILGLSGICIVFWHDLSALAATRSLIGLGMALIGAYLASVGNVVGARNAASGVPVTQANVYGMAYGGLLTLAIHFGGGGELVMDWSVGYLAPMLYLTIFGSVVAFGCYMLLIGRIGAEYAAYVTLLMPIIALLLSTIFEDFLWTTHAGLGVVIVLVGNLFILTPAETLIRAYRRVRPV